MSGLGTENRGPGLSASGLRDIFPFYFALDRELRLVQFGRSLSKVCSNLQVGVPLLTLFSIARPRIKPTLEALLRARANTFFLDSVTQPIRMRGQIYHDQESELLLFLGAPWFTDLAALQQTSLVLSDFTVHDPLIDFLSLVQAKTIALADAEKLSAMVSKQRDELVEVNTQLEQAMTAKTQFLANTSHELRTPLNGIIGMASLLTRLKLSTQQRHYADTILKSGRTLLTVVNDILDISKIEAGQMMLEQLDFNLHSLISETIDAIAVTAQNKGLELVCVIDKELPEPLHGDPMRIGQVLNNLLGNAVKFTTQGEVVVRISRILAPAPEVGLRIEVQDTGIGIAAAHQEKIFRPFSQADASMSRRFGGTGLGLALCREIANLMGGEIGMTSIEGAGSTFWFTARLHTAVRLVSTSPALWEDFLDKKRVLLVEDNASNREYIQTLIRQWGGLCHAVESGVQAIESLRTGVAEDRPYDLLLLDMHLPGMSGMELISVLAGDALFDDLLMVMLGSLAAETRHKLPQCKRLNAHLSKPIHPAVLRTTLAELLHAGSNKKNVLSVVNREESSDTIVPFKPHPELPVNAQRVLIVDDNLVNLEVAVRMLETLGYHSDLATNGAEALNALAHHSYGLVLMDLQMPVVSGYEATAAIRSREGSARHTTIIAMTAHAMPADRRRALEGGMDDYISKPIELENLAALLGHWLPNGAAPIRAAAQVTPGVGASSPDSRVIDCSRLEQLRQLQAEGEDLVATVVASFVADLSARTQVVRTAATRNDRRALSREGHALKSSSQLVGALQLAALCGELEHCATIGDPTLLDDLVDRFLSACTQAQHTLVTTARS